DIETIIHEQEIIESSNSHAKSKVWDYFTKPYGLPKSRKANCHECGNIFSYHGSTSTLKYHLVHRHKIDISTNLSQKSKVWDYFTEPYGSPNDKNCKIKCLKCEMEFLYNVSTFSLKFHLIRKHNIVMSKNLESIADLNKVLEIEPNNAKVLKSRGKAYKRMGKYEEFIADSSRALEIESNNVNALISRGKACAELANMKNLKFRNRNKTKTLLHSTDY
ncbi:7658_t:CDS:2, partial [Diversispora eburnea]